MAVAFLLEHSHAATWSLHSLPPTFPLPSGPFFLEFGLQHSLQTIRLRCPTKHNDKRMANINYNALSNAQCETPAMPRHEGFKQRQHTEELAIGCCCCASHTVKYVYLSLSAQPTMALLAADSKSVPPPVQANTGCLYDGSLPC